MTDQNWYKNAIIFYCSVRHEQFKWTRQWCDAQWFGLVIGLGRNVLNFREFITAKHVRFRFLSVGTWQSHNIFMRPTISTVFMIDNIQLHGNYRTFLIDSVQPYTYPYIHFLWFFSLSFFIFFPLLLSCDVKSINYFFLSLLG